MIHMLSVMFVETSDLDPDHGRSLGRNGNNSS